MSTWYGEEELVDEEVPLGRRLQLIKDMSAKNDASFSLKHKLISAKSCNALIEHVETSLAYDLDSGIKLPAGGSSNGAEDAFESWTSQGGISNQYHKKLYANEIVSLIGKNETMKIIGFFHNSFGDMTIDSMYLVRQGVPEAGYYDVRWHKDDYATMEITLNEDYIGGHVLHLNADGVYKT